MSRVSSPSLDPVEATARRPLAKAERLTLLDQQGDRCGCCGESLIWTVLDTGQRVYGPMIDEHIIPLWQGGSNDLANRQMWCAPCSKAKTKQDLRDIAKVKRLQRQANPETRRKSPRPMRSRGFRKDPLRV